MWTATYIGVIAIREEFSMAIIIEHSDKLLFRVGGKMHAPLLGLIVNEYKYAHVTQY